MCLHVCVHEQHVCSCAYPTLVLLARPILPFSCAGKRHGSHSLLVLEYLVRSYVTNFSRGECVPRHSRTHPFYDVITWPIPKIELGFQIKLIMWVTPDLYLLPPRQENGIIKFESIPMQPKFNGILESDLHPFKCDSKGFFLYIYCLIVSSSKL